MAYTVFTQANDDDDHGSGLTLVEAFVRMMALAGCDYAFRRFGGVMRLTITHQERVPEEYLADPRLREHYYPVYCSKLRDDELARDELMRRFFGRGMKGIQIVTDEYYWQHKTARCRGRQGVQAHHFTVQLAQRAAPRELVVSSLGRSCHIRDRR